MLRNFAKRSIEKEEGNMAKNTFTIYKRIKLAAGKWRYLPAVYSSNGKIKATVMVDGKEKKHDGSYFLSHDGGWIPVGTDALEAQRRRTEALQGRILPTMQSPAPAADIDAPAVMASGKITLQQASDKYFKDLADYGRDSKTIASYRLGIDPFVKT
jgi:hypothetical protein